MAASCFSKGLFIPRAYYLYWQLQGWEIVLLEFSFDFYGKKETKSLFSHQFDLRGKLKTQKFETNETTISKWTGNEERGDLRTPCVYNTSCRSRGKGSIWGFPLKVFLPSLNFYNKRSKGKWKSRGLYSNFALHAGESMCLSYRDIFF